jgi:tetratricopeptide (TPR) repeat protein
MMFVRKSFICLLLLTGFFVISANAQQNRIPQTEADADGKPRAERPKTKAEAEALNQRILENNIRIQKVLNDGIIAFTINDFQTAIDKFDEGIRLDPNYWGTAPTLLTNKAVTLRTVGILKYSEAAKQNSNSAIVSQPYFQKAIDELKKARQILDGNTELIPDSEKENFEKYKFNIVKELAESFRLLVLTDKTRTSEAVDALENYVSIEIDLVKKERALNELNKLKIVGRK